MSTLSVFIDLSTAKQSLKSLVTNRADLELALSQAQDELARLGDDFTLFEQGCYWLFPVDWPLLSKWYPEGAAYRRQKAVVRARERDLKLVCYREDEARQNLRMLVIRNLCSENPEFDRFYKELEEYRAFVEIFQKANAVLQELCELVQDKNHVSVRSGFGYSDDPLGEGRDRLRAALSLEPQLPKRFHLSNETRAALVVSGRLAEYPQYFEINPNDPWFSSVNSCALYLTKILEQEEGELDARIQPYLDLGG